MSSVLSSEPVVFGRPPSDGEWRALKERAATPEALYAVRSTGVFCRFGCPSRRPARENVLVFATPADAEQAGFRACRRCRPGMARGRARSPAEKMLVSEICRYLETQPGRVPTLRELSERFSRSSAHLQRVFKRNVGISPRAYADALRVAHFKNKLRDGKSVTHAMVEAGYGSTSRLYESASKTLGMTPRAYRDKARGQEITYTTARCPLGGRLLVAATARGVCSVGLGAYDRALIDALKDEFQGAVLRRGDHRFCAPLLAYLKGLGPLPELPVEIRATAFQRRVWDAIRAIPAGTTQTYGELAAALGAPRAVRAVAQACARNPVALVVPCHRVVSKRGPGGYRFGVARKEQLLTLDASLAQTEDGLTSGRRRSPR